jgi:hypothetical protein
MVIFGGLDGLSWGTMSSKFVYLYLKITNNYTLNDLLNGLLGIGWSVENPYTHRLETLNGEGELIPTTLDELENRFARRQSFHLHLWNANAYSLTVWVQFISNTLVETYYLSGVSDEDIERLLSFIFSRLKTGITSGIVLGMV